MIYLHVFADAPEEIALPALPREIVSASVLGGDPVEAKTSATEWTVSLPASMRKPIATVVKITLDASSMDLMAVDALKD